VAAPVGHLFCALVFLNSGHAEVKDKAALMAGTSFPDIRYIAPISRKLTHRLAENNMRYVASAPSSFEMGRRLHVRVDKEREKYMKAHDVYRFVKDEPYPTHLLKLVEDNILFEKLGNLQDLNSIFDKVYIEEQSYGLSDAQIRSWHNILKSYLNPNHYFNFFRYYSAASQYKKEFGLPEKLFGNFWQSIKTITFFFAAYFKIEKLSRNVELRKLILDFYEKNGCQEKP
jgi:hypothetical protein